MGLTYLEKYRLKSLENTMNIPLWKYFLRFGGISAIVFFAGYAGFSWIEKKTAFSLRDLLISAGAAIFTSVANASIMWYIERKEYKKLLRKKGDEKWKTLT